MKKIICVLLSLIMLSATAFNAFADDAAEYCENHSFTKNTYSYLWQSSGKEYGNGAWFGWLNDFHFDKEGLVDRLSADEYETKLAYAQSQNCVLAYDGNVEKGVSLISADTVIVNLKPGYCGIVQKLEFENTFPELDVESYITGNEYYVKGREEGAIFMDLSRYETGAYILHVEIKLKKSGLHALNDALDYLYSLDHVIGAYYKKVAPDSDTQVGEDKAFIKYRFDEDGINDAIGKLADQCDPSANITREIIEEYVKDYAAKNRGIVCYSVPDPRTETEYELCIIKNRSMVVTVDFPMWEITEQTDWHKVLPGVSWDSVSVYAYDSFLEQDPKYVEAHPEYFDTTTLSLRWNAGNASFETLTDTAAKLNGLDNVFMFQYSLNRSSKAIKFRLEKMYKPDDPTPKSKCGVFAFDEPGLEIAIKKIAVRYGGEEYADLVRERADRICEANNTVLGYYVDYYELCYISANTLDVTVSIPIEEAAAGFKWSDIFKGIGFEDVAVVSERMRGASDKEYTLTLTMRHSGLDSLISAAEKLEEIDAVTFYTYQTVVWIKSDSLGIPDPLSPIITLGDLNGNGVVDARDVVELMKYVVNKTASQTLNKSADINCDKKINSRDIVLLMKKVLGGSTVTSSRISTLCALLGHDLSASYATEIVHRVHAASPHCEKRTYLVISCGHDGCDYIEKILTSTTRIASCHG